MRWPTWPEKSRDAEVERMKREGSRAGVPVEGVEGVLGVVARDRDLPLRELVRHAVRLRPPLSPRATHPPGCPRVSAPSPPPSAPSAPSSSPPQLLGTTRHQPPLSQSPLPPAGRNPPSSSGQPPHPLCLRPLDRCGQRTSPSPQRPSEGTAISLSFDRGSEKEPLLRGFRLLPAKWLKQRPESGLDCLICAEFSRT